MGNCTPRIVWREPLHKKNIYSILAARNRSFPLKSFATGSCMEGKKRPMQRLLGFKSCACPALFEARIYYKEWTIKI